MQKDMCSVAACVLPVKAKALCNAHYLRSIRFGNPLGSGRRVRTLGLPKRMLRR